MEEKCSKLYSTQKIVEKLLQQLVTESTDPVPATQPLLYSASTNRLQSLQITRPVYRLYSLVFTKAGYRVITVTTGYRAYRPGTGYTALLHQNRLQSLPTKSIQLCVVDSGAGRCGSSYKNYFD